MNLDDIKERNNFINKNLGLVHACARRFMGKGIEYDDLFSAGCMGLVKAYDAFDTSRGVKFSTYAVPVILGEIKRLFRDGGSVKVSRSLKELALKVAKKREEIIIKKGKEPTLSEMAHELKTSVEQLTQAICSSSPTISLTQNLNDGKEEQLDIECKEENLNLADKIAIKDAILNLDRKDRSLIFFRYFCGDTQSQTAQKLNMTQVQVSRREKKILAALKKRLT